LPQQQVCCSLSQQPQFFNYLEQFCNHNSEMSNSIFNNLRVILLDRDGVINEEPGPILSPEQFVMIPKSAAAVARLNARGWRCFVITNQAAFARCDLS